MANQNDRNKRDWDYAEVAARHIKLAKSLQDTCIPLQAKLQKALADALKEEKGRL
jgi:hypothetical protein